MKMETEAVLVSLIPDEVHLIETYRIGKAGKKTRQHPLLRKVWTMEELENKKEGRLILTGMTKKEYKKIVALLEENNNRQAEYIVRLEDRVKSLEKELVKCKRILVKEILRMERETE